MHRPGHKKAEVTNNTRLKENMYKTRGSRILSELARFPRRSLRVDQGDISVANRSRRDSACGSPTPWRRRAATPTWAFGPNRSLESKSCRSPHHAKETRILPVKPRGQLLPCRQRPIFCPTIFGATLNRALPSGVAKHNAIGAALIALRQKRVTQFRLHCKNTEESVFNLYRMTQQSFDPCLQDLLPGFPSIARNLIEYPLIAPPEP